MNDEKILRFALSFALVALSCVAALEEVRKRKDADLARDAQQVLNAIAKSFADETKARGRAWWKFWGKP